MKEKSIFALVLAASLFVGCTMELKETSSVDSNYGTLVSLNSRSVNYNNLDVEDIKRAKIFVSGTGITEGEEPSAFCDVSDGSGSFKIDKIPVGKNRIVTVQGFDESGNVIDEAVLKAVVDINSGVNELGTITRATSVKGFIYSALLEDGQNLDNQTSALESIIPSIEDCSYNLTRINFSSMYF